jgi:tetratricopeptide (TPR) repeat protein
VYLLEGKYADAEGLYNRALRIRDKALGEDHPDVAATLSGLALVYLSQEKYADAAALDKRALTIREKALGREHPGLVPILNVLASLYRKQGKDAEAEPLYKRALTISEKYDGADSLSLATPLIGLATVYAKQGKVADAEQLTERTLAIREKALGKKLANENPKSMDLLLNALANTLRDNDLWMKYIKEDPVTAGKLVMLASKIEKKIEQHVTVCDTDDRSRKTCRTIILPPGAVSPGRMFYRIGESEDGMPLYVPRR